MNLLTLGKPQGKVNYEPIQRFNFFNLTRIYKHILFPYIAESVCIQLLLLFIQ